MPKITKESRDRIKAAVSEFVCGINTDQGKRAISSIEALEKAMAAEVYADALERYTPYIGSDGNVYLGPFCISFDRQKLAKLMSFPEGAEVECIKGRAKFIGF